MNIKAAKDYAIARLQEPTTWRGVILMATAAGSHLNPDQREAIIAGGLMAAGLVGAITKDPAK